MSDPFKFIFKLIALSVLGSVLPGLAVAQQAKTPLNAAHVDAAITALDGVVADVMAASGVPGVAVAVVRNGETVFAKGYGLREVGQPGAVAEDTVFQIASLSKSLAATVVARRVGKDGLDWSTPIRSLLPDFELSDPWVSSHVTIGDMFAHRSGLPERTGDVLEDLGYDRTQVLARMKLVPLKPFRISYGYSNFGLTAGAEAVATAAGTDWETLSETALYGPLGMTRTSSRFDDFIAHEDRAIGHTMIDEVFTPYRSRTPDPQSPAGGVSSTVTDFAKWMTMVLDDGKFGGEDFVTNEAFLPAITPEVISRAAPNQMVLPEFYGYGIGVGPDATGRMRLSHSGAFVLGAATRYVMIPEEKLGIVVFTNGTPVGAPESIAAIFMDMAEFGTAQRDWWTLFSDGFRPFRAPVGELAGKTTPYPGDPAAPPSSYVGTYTSPYYGPATVAIVEDGLTLIIGPKNMTFPLRHWSGDRYYYSVLNENMPDGSVAEVTFGDMADGTAQSLSIDYLLDGGLGVFRR